MRAKAAPIKASRTMALEPKPRVTQTNRMVEAMVNPAGPIKTTLSTSPAVIQRSAARSGATAFSSSGCQPPCQASMRRRTPSNPRAAAVISGTTVGPTLALRGDTGIDIACQNMTIASTSTPAPMIVSPTAGRGRRGASSWEPLVMSGKPELFENALDPRRFNVEEGFVIVAEKRDLRPVVHLAGLGPLRRCGHFLHQCDHRLALCVVDAGRREHAPPIEQLHVDAFLFQRRRGDVFLAFVSRYGDHPQLSGFHLLCELAIARDAGRHLVAQ